MAKKKRGKYQKKRSLRYAPTGHSKHDKHAQDGNVYQALVKRSGESFEPEKEPEPCNAPAGSVEKLEELTKRVERGEELWSEKDRTEFDDECPTKFTFAFLGGKH